jgi:glycine cleavage system H protein
MDFPEDLRYTTDHEWVRLEGNLATVGITDFAQDALGDVVYVAPAEVGDAVDAGANVAEIESTKSVSEIYSPLGGTVVARNELLDDQPELVNQQPYGDGWMFRIEVRDLDVIQTLMDAAQYRNLVE